MLCQGFLIYNKNLFLNFNLLCSIFQAHDALNQGKDKENVSILEPIVLSSSDEDESYHVPSRPTTSASVCFFVIEVAFYTSHLKFKSICFNLKFKTECLVPKFDYVLFLS
jgi:hypothetical protein